MKVYVLGAAFLALAVAVSAVNKDWEAYQSLMKTYQTDPQLRQQWARHMRKFFLANLPRIMSNERENPMFKCEGDRSAEVPTSVDNLLPGDIKIVGALGDSITAGFGIKAITAIDVLIQDRGHSFSVGGRGSYDGGIITLPNILKNYNAELYGYSTDFGDVDSEEAMFNVAIGGSRAPDLPEQADMIIERMSGDNLVNMANDWKMVTVFIGGNDLCRLCDDEEGLGPRAFLRNMEQTLDILAAGLPRTLVNVIPIMDITPLPRISEDLVCDAIQAVVCPCAVDSAYHEMLQKAQSEYSAYTSSLINSGKYDRDDFTVVFQPFLRDAKPPKDSSGQNDLSYFAPDCFHFSERGHQSLTRSLWNSLFVPVGRKVTTMTFKEEVTCPPKGTLIATNRNSRSTLVKDNAPADVIPDVIPDVMAARASGAASGGGARPWTVGVAVVGTVVGVLAVLVLVLVVVAMRRRKVEPTLNLS